MSAKAVQKEIRALGSKERAKDYSWFFKTGPGQYGEGDRFLGVSMPDIRKVVKGFRELSFSDIKTLLKSTWHEERMAGLLILVLQYQKTNDAQEKQDIFDFYLANRVAINNWDLVDVTTPHIVGTHLLSRPKKERSFLYDFARSENMWERRIAMLATFPFIRERKFTDALAIAEILLGDTEDLLHKAVGWMLREIGKQDEEALKQFLEKHVHHMPRTTLRYAIEKFPEKERKMWLKK
jgi:3-methyladenine DNA glycosylase AlkD